MQIWCDHGCEQDAEEVKKLMEKLMALGDNDSVPLSGEQIQATIEMMNAKFIDSGDGKVLCLCACRRVFQLACLCPCLCDCAWMDPTFCEKTLAASRSFSLLNQVTWPEMWDGIVEMVLGDPNADPDDLKVPPPHLMKQLHALKSDCCIPGKFDMCIHVCWSRLCHGHAPWTPAKSLPQRHATDCLTYTRVHEQSMFEERVKTDQEAENLIEIVKNLNIFDS